jgi:hypothetical protein
LRGELFEVLDFFGDGAERAGFDDFARRAVIQDERQRAENRAERDAGGGSDDFPAANRVRRLLDEENTAAASSSASPRRNGHLGTFQFIESFTCQFREKMRRMQFAFSSTKTARAKIIRAVPICVIFNPAARGNKARHFRRQLDAIGSQCALKATAAPGDARRLAAEAVDDGFDLIVAAGGDGTVNEVLNGIGDAPDGFARARLGVLPLGTVNVFARELENSAAA